MAVRDLQQEVWAANLDRYEPDELGDTPRSLGLLTYENFATRAVRRFAHDDLEPVDTHWDIDGLKLTAPRGVLTFELEGITIISMKLPPAEARVPNWDHLVNWDNESNTRLEFARKNSLILGGYTSPSLGQGEFGDYRQAFGQTPGKVRSFVYAWAGELTSPLTSGWLTVPIVGTRPFAAVSLLWRDSQVDLAQDAHTPKRRPDGPSFDQKPAAQPAIALRPKPAIEGEA